MPTQLIPTAEAVYIAGVDERSFSRVMDEDLMPAALYDRQDGSRQFTRLGAAFARFYFATEAWLQASLRKQAIAELTARVQEHESKEGILALVEIKALNWKVQRLGVEIDVSPFIRDSFLRVKEVDQAEALVTASPDVMSGSPVFAGTRVPIDIVLSSQEKGIGMDRLQAAYPFLTAAHLQSARVFAAIHPRRGRPRRLAEVNPDLKPKVTRVVRRVAAA